MYVLHKYNDISFAHPECWYRIELNTAHVYKIMCQTHDQFSLYVNIYKTCTSCTIYMGLRY